MILKYEAFEKQVQFHQSLARVRGAFAGKRGGKTEAGAIETIIHAINQPLGKEQIDPYLIIVIAPTYDMLRTICFEKIKAYAKVFNTKYHQTNLEMTFQNGSIIRGISADKPQRLEGQKASAIWIDEALQVKAQVFREAKARLADRRGYLWLTSSLGEQYNNPKSHWAYKELKETNDNETEVFEWSTSDNPYFPKEELERLKKTLNPKTFRQMFTIDWSVTPDALVFEDFDESNIIRGYQYDPKLETSISVDWGWNHPMVCLFLQYDRINDKVYLFDEIIGSKIKREELLKRIRAKGYKIDNYYCDPAGIKEDEAMAMSNVEFFKANGINFKYRRSRIVYGLNVVKQYILTGSGERKFFIDEIKCPDAMDGILNYGYQVKNGQITEDPNDEGDDVPDALRYYFVNRHRPDDGRESFTDLSRWKFESFR